MTEQREKTFSERYLLPDGTLRKIPESEARSNVLAYADETSRLNVELRKELAETQAALQKVQDLALERGGELAETRAKLEETESDRDVFERYWAALARKDHEGLVITPAERAVLDAMAKAPDGELRFLAAPGEMPMAWLRVLAASELARRGEKP